MTTVAGIDDASAQTVSIAIAPNLCCHYAIRIDRPSVKSPNKGQQLTGP